MYLQQFKKYSSTKYMLILLVVLSIPAVWPFFQQQFFPTQDYIYIARLQQMVVAMTDMQFPVRWVKDLRYGEPLFNFYAPLPYYVGGVIKIITDFLGIGLSFIIVTKLLFISAVVLSAFTMYLFARTFFGKLGGVLSALLYVYAPYHSVDIFVRGALAETWALVFFPLIFWSIFRLADKYSRMSVFYLVLSLSGLFLTHNIMTLLFAPFIGIWMLVVSRGSFKRLIIQLFSLLLAVGISAFYLLPAFFEKNLVQPTALLNSYYDYRAHFVAIDQLLFPSWGYGASVWGYEDGLSFQLGLVHWGVMSISGLILFFALLLFLKAKKRISLSLSFSFPEQLNRKLFLFLVLFSLFVLSLFMTHNQSTPIWKNITLLQFSQFPWRFLGISIFFASFFGGFLLYFWKRWRVAFSVGFIVVLLLVNLPYFRPDYYYPFTDADFVSERELKNETKLPKDYVPQYVKEFDRAHIFEPNFTENSGLISDYQLKTGSASFTVFSESGGTVEVPIYYFEGWKAFENERKIMIADPDKFGLIRIPVSKGTNFIRLSFDNTPIRTAANVISFMSVVVLLLFVSGMFSKRFFK